MSVDLHSDIGIQHAREQGFGSIPNVVTVDRCEHLRAELASIPGGRAGRRHLMSHSAVAELAGDVALLKIAGESLGRPATPYRATFFEKTEQANWLIAWHQDTGLPLAQRFEDPAWGPGR